MQKIAYVADIIALLRSNIPSYQLLMKLSKYHEKDIATALVELDRKERVNLYPILGPQIISDIFSYIEDPNIYLDELPLASKINIISKMDCDEVVDVLEDINSAEQDEIVSLLEKDLRDDVNLILSYDDDQMGSKLTTNFIQIDRNCTIKSAMSELIKQAGENDNISTIYVCDQNKFYGAIDLKDLIIARENQNLEDIISTQYPYFYDDEKLDNCLESLKDYQEDSIPVLTRDNELIGVITSQDIIEAVDTQLSDDYAKLGGLSEESDLKESTIVSMKKRLPWLFALLFLGLIVSTVVGIFESIVAIIPIVICFQSLILDMAGNIGTQSLAVTIRVLMDDNLKRREKLKLVVKEAKVGLFNGLVLGSLAFIFIGLFIYIFKGNSLSFSFSVSFCVCISLAFAMLVSSLVGTLIPMLFNRLRIDPAVASGPLITTVNDLVAVVSYYSLVWLLLVRSIS